MEYLSILWLVLMLGFLIVESSTVTMVSIWFAAGALVALILSLLQAQLWVQVAAFLVVSCGLLAALRPLVRKYITPKIIRTNIDSIPGTTGVVTRSIDNLHAAGQVKLGAMEWTARSASGEPILEGTLIRVVRIEGVKAIVEPTEVSVEQE